MLSAQTPESHRIDFSYAFATPHRLTAALPDSGDKTLLDLEPGSLRIAWTYDDLLRKPLASFTPINSNWGLRVTPQVDGHNFGKSAWTRLDGFLPALSNDYDDANASARVEVVGGITACVSRITLTNKTKAPVKVTVLCESERAISGYCPGYMQSGEDADCLLAGWGDRADRVLILQTGAETCDVPRAAALLLGWTLGPNETKSGLLVRPYRAYAEDLPALRKHDWSDEFDKGKAVWHALVDRSLSLRIPDAEMVRAYRACLTDLFIMREPVAGGYVAAVPGTEGYRATNSGEAAVVAVALDQTGLSTESAQGFQMCLDQQGENGDWADPRGWCHLMWAISGFKSWAAMEHFKVTRDMEYLARIYPHLRASSRFQESQRARTRVVENGEKSIAYGLMPRGMGDCGLMDDNDYYGVFLPHNIWAVYADKVAFEAATILGKTDEAAELGAIYETAHKDLLQTLDRGAIQADGYRWIPCVAGKTCGSRWGALNVLFPCGLLPKDHELVNGTFKYMRANMSPGGLPVHTGWQPKGLWMAISLDNLAEAHLARNEGDEAAALLYATINHGTPLFTWCEERGQEPGAKDISGDRQHLWTPVAVVRAVRDVLVMEDDTVLHLGRGIDRAWLATGEPVGVSNALTHFGATSYELKYDAGKGTVHGAVSLSEQARQDGLSAVAIHVRLPEGARIASVQGNAPVTVSADGATLDWSDPHGQLSFDAVVGK
jgi:hypothetical protein